MRTILSLSPYDNAAAELAALQNYAKALLAIAAPLLPMMLAQTVMQLRAGVAFGLEAEAPLIGFSLVSAGAVYFLWKLARPAMTRSTHP